MRLKRKIDDYLVEWKNKKFQIIKISTGARNREYVGVVKQLKNAGIVNICYCLDQVSFPLKGNYNHFNTYKSAVYENVVGDMLVKEGYDLYFYRDEAGRLEMDFFVRDVNSLILIVKLYNKNIGFN